MKSLYSIDKVRKRGNTLIINWDCSPIQILKFKKKEYEKNNLYSEVLPQPYYSYSTIKGLQKPSPYFGAAQKELNDPSVFKTFPPLFNLKFKRTLNLRPIAIFEYK